MMSSSPREAGVAQPRVEPATGSARSSARRRRSPASCWCARTRAPPASPRATATPSTPGSSSAASSRTRRSCAGLTNENRKHDRERLDALQLHAPQRAPHRVLVERHDDVALEVEPLGHAVALAARTDRRRRRQRRIPDVLLVAAPDLDLVAMAVAGDEPGRRRPTSRSSCCRRSSCRGRSASVRASSSASVEPSRAASCRDAAEHALGLVARRRRMLVERRARRRATSTRSVKVPPTSMPMR